MKYLITFTSLLITAACFGQTKLISHRSHSGSNATFRTAIEHDLFDIGDSNFGAITQVVKAIDSVVLKPDGSILVLKKRYTVTTPGGIKPRGNVYTQDTIAKKDTHAFLTAKSIDALKGEVKKAYPAFKTDSIQFIGFDKQLPRSKRALKK